MFTGLVENIATIKELKITSSGAVVSYFCPFDLKEIKIGDSISVNGVCLTVKSIENGIISSDIMKETLDLTNLKNLKNGDIVNLERAMKISSRLDGHIVSGHVDCVAIVKKITEDGFSKRIRFSCDTDLIIKKGSIAINGTSLTVTDVSKDEFEVSLIPLTQKETNLKNLKINDIVNIEYDLFAKYVQKFTQKKEEKSKITFEFLKENGF